MGKRAPDRKVNYWFLGIAASALWATAAITAYIWLFDVEIRLIGALPFIGPLLLFLPFVLVMFFRLRSRRETPQHQEEVEDAFLPAHAPEDFERVMSDAIIASIGDGISIQSREFRILYQNQVHKGLTGEHPGEYCYRAYEQCEAVCEGCPAVLSFADGGIHRAEREIATPAGTRYFEITTSPLRDEHGNITSVIETVRETTARRCAEEKLKILVERLRAQRTIDSAITSSMDLGLMLNVFLEQATRQLGADAADVLLVNPHAMSLEYAAGKGFRTDAVKNSKVKLGENGAGRVALEKRSLMVPYISEPEDGSSRFSILKKEGIMAYCCVPIVSKGKTNGVLEVYHRTAFEPDEDWLEFLESLAVQAAIAIDNATLFGNLQASHNELVMAYDSTIEGWSRAMDYRDTQTQGHSSRVTKLAMEIARAMGMNEDELVHMRRGALLHDIGKLGVPDSILHKPGRLDENEWFLMRKHPEIAYKLLSPVRYLNPALDIPYCHHERWDGSGYPRGLKGEQIPLAARIFTVVDVWDALLSDRPYRPALSRGKAIAYIREMAGTHFDPTVVDVFMDIIESGRDNDLD